MSSQDGLFGAYAEVAQLRTWIDEKTAANGGATFCSATGTATSTATATTNKPGAQETRREGKGSKKIKQS